MKRVFICLSAIIILNAPLSADVIRLADGRILLGKVAGSEGGVALLESGGEKKIVPQIEIVKTEPDLSALRSQTVEVFLKDGSVLSGKVKDFDPDVGLLLDIAFGSITLPFTSIDQISDPVQRNAYAGFPVTISLTGGYYFTIGDSRPDFSDNFNINVSLDVNPKLLRGLFFGVGLAYLNLSYAPNPSLAYLVINAQVRCTYRFLQFRTTGSFLKSFVPYISVGAGGAYVNTYDPRSGYETSAGNEMDFSFSGNVGVDFFVIDRFIIRLDGGWVSILQSASLFNALSVNLGAAVCF